MRAPGGPPTSSAVAPARHHSGEPGADGPPTAAPPGPAGPPPQAGPTWRTPGGGAWRPPRRRRRGWHGPPPPGGPFGGDRPVFGSRHGHWTRSRTDRMFAGVAGGLAERFGIDTTLVRVGFVIATLVAGVGLPLYVAAWLLMPLEGHDESIGTRVVKDRQGLLLALAFLPAMVAVMVAGSAVGAGWVTSFAWTLFLFAAGGVLVWRNSDAEERAWLRAAADPVVRIGSGSRRSWRRLALRVGLAVVLLGLAVLSIAHHGNHYSPYRPVVGGLLIVAAVVVLFGPWWLRLLRDLVEERQARVRAEDRADMAARVHDSVLQTLAMIQRSAGDSQKVVQLARAQERELRAWLFEGDIPGAVGGDVTTVAAGMHAIATEVEELHGVPVDVVTVGDGALDERLRALLDAAREAAVNAAKWSGAPRVSLFSEVEPARVSVFVRDRGKGFDPDAVAPDRHGIAESIQARMLRHGGRATVRTAAGQGTEVELVMPTAGAR
jgi:phage shock protein PspC (stress-responsive transcriptional regulator)